MDPEVRQRVLRQITYGLYVITVRHEEQVAAGTVNWLTQISIEPPLVAVGMKSGSGIAELTERAGRFAVNILGLGQKEIAAAFFVPAVVTDHRINDVPFRVGSDGMPVLTPVPCAFECHVEETVRKGDHDLVIGRVTTVHEHHVQAPLVLAATGWVYGG
jgi:flavin reductase (DIM6/NTAB) family NADH-FMN oxidoreductase RutF